MLDTLIPDKFEHQTVKLFWREWVPTLYFWQLSEKWADSKIRGWADPDKQKKSEEDQEPFDNNPTV